MFLHLFKPTYTRDVGRSKKKRCSSVSAEMVSLGIYSLVICLLSDKLLRKAKSPGMSVVYSTCPKSKLKLKHSISYAHCQLLSILLSFKI